MSKLEAKLKASLKAGARPAASAKAVTHAKTKSAVTNKPEPAQAPGPKQAERRADSSSLHPKRIWPD